MAHILLNDITVSYDSGKSVHNNKLRWWVKKKLKDLTGKTNGPKTFKALDSVSISAEPGQVVGIIGRNGAGKTTLMRVVAGILEPDSGTVDVSGSISSVFNLGAGFIPELNGRENIYLVCALHNISEKRTREIEEDIISFSGLGKAIDRPVKTYSSGMRSRLGFSIVAFIDSDIIALDEALSAGDHSFRKKAGNLIERFADNKKILLVISHSATVIRDHCTHCYLLENGRIAEFGSPLEVLEKYQKDAT